MERLNKLDKLRKTLYSKIGLLHNININLSEITDDILVKNIEKTNYDGNDSLSIWKSDSQESEIIDKFNEFSNTIMSILVERSKISSEKLNFCQKITLTTKLFVFFSSYFFDNNQFLL